MAVPVGSEPNQWRLLAPGERMPVSHSARYQIGVGFRDGEVFQRILVHCGRPGAFFVCRYPQLGVNYPPVH